MLSLTVTNPASNGFATMWPCGHQRPLASNVNFTAGQTAASAVLAQIGDGGAVCVASNVDVDVVVDVQGWMATGAGYLGNVPERLADTRNGDTDIEPNVAAGTGSRSPASRGRLSGDDQRDRHQPERRRLRDGERVRTTRNGIERELCQGTDGCECSARAGATGRAQRASNRTWMSTSSSICRARSPTALRITRWRITRWVRIASSTRGTELSRIVRAASVRQVGDDGRRAMPQTR